MLCFCKDYVQAAFVLGIVLAGLNLLTCFNKGNGAEEVLSGIYGALISGILIFGAKMRNPTAILVWIALAIINVVGLIVWTVSAIIALIAITDHVTLAMVFPFIFIIFLGAMIMFEIWTIIVAKKARDEIQAPGGGQIPLL